MKYQVTSVEYLPGVKAYSHHILIDENNIPHNIDLMFSGQYSRCVNPNDLVGLTVTIKSLSTYISIAKGIDVCYR